MKNILFIFFLINYIFYGQLCKQSSFILLDKSYQSDLNYLAINSINSKDKGLIMLDSVFNVLNGNFTIYRFITKDRGILFDEFESDLNHLIILKVDSLNQIVDGYYYFLQNPEMPSSCSLYKLTKKIKLKSKININDLKFRKIIGKSDDIFEICKDIPLYINDNRFLGFK